MTNIKKLLATLRVRGAYRATLTALRLNDLPTGLGWDGIEEKLLEEADEPERREEIVKALSNVLIQLLMYHDKAIKLFTVPQQDLHRVAQILPRMVESDNPFVGTYPLTLPESVLRRASMSPKATALHVDAEDHSHSLVFCSRRYVTEREDFEVDKEDARLPEGLRRFDVLVGIRRQPIQLYDVVVVRPHQGLVELRLDGIRKLSHDDIRATAKAVKGRFNELLKSAGSAFQIDGATNLFPAISALYEADDGIVTELGHVTTGASVKHERMRRKTLDLREETYHHAGKDAVGDLDSYRIAVGWTVGRRSSVELRLPGSVALTTDVDKKLYIAEVRGCIEKHHYDFALKKLVAALH